MVPPMSRVLHWNGIDLPEELRDLPAGRYVVESVDEVPELTDDEEEGIRHALASLRSGNGRTLDQVRESIASVLCP